MSTLSIRVRYRPVRLGWCVRDGHLEDVRRAIRLSHTLWGGRFNPIIPIGKDNKLAHQLTEVFRVDALFPVVDDSLVQRFIEEHPYLPWPDVHKDLFIDGVRGRVSTFIDIYHPVRKIFEQYVKDRDEPKVATTIWEWDATDPLADVWLAYLGSYPSKEEIGKDYSSFIERNLKARRVKLNLSEGLPPELHKSFMPSSIGAYQLQWDRPPTWEHPGLYVGSAGDFQDVVNFWNLRAADIELVFHDPAYEERLRGFRDSWLAELRARPADPTGWDDRIAIWTKDRGSLKEDYGSKTVRCTVSDETWNSLNVKPSLMYIDDESTLASISDEGRVPSLSFQLARKPFFDDVELHNQHLIASLNLIAPLSANPDATFKYPYIPELNEYYGREAYYLWNVVRSEREGLGIVISVTTNDLRIQALEKRKLISKIFETFGLSCSPSEPGRIAARLIQQMGGTQGCRVFKIGGVRELIETYKPSQAFTRSGAIQAIRQVDPVTGQSNFQVHEGLFIEYREKAKLKPEDAFSFLVKKGVFRVGLNLQCPICELKFWLPLDDIATEVKCEYCGQGFHITPQLRDRDWAYRRSGLFGKDDHQEGSVPVALTLQQLDTVLHWDSFFVTGMNIDSGTVKVGKCETDFVFLSQKGYEDGVQLAIAECKGKDQITEQDVSNLAQVADAFPSNRFETYIVFSKTAPFTAEEVQRCRKAQTEYRRRVILLSDRELEPYFVYERAKKEFDIRSTAMSLEDLARATHDIYFEPKIRKQSPTP